jgi:hypothetical protein
MVVSANQRESDRSPAADVAGQELGPAEPASASRRDRLVGLIAEVLVGAILAAVSAWGALERILLPPRSAPDQNE